LSYLEFLMMKKSSSLKGPEDLRTRAKESLNSEPDRPGDTRLDEVTSKAEAALAESEQRFKLLYERAPLAYQSLDENGNVIEINQAWLEALGYAKEEVIGRNFADFLRPDLVSHFKENFSRFKAAGEVLGVEFEMVKKDGSTMLVSFHGKIGRDLQGRFKQTHCIFQNITEQRRAEERLRESEQRFRSLFERNRTVMLLIEPDSGAILDANEGAVEFYGYSRTELRAMNIAQINQLPSEVVAEARRSILELKTNSFVFPHRLRSGEVRTVEVYSYPIEMDGRIVLFSIVHDITERAKQTREIEHLNRLYSVLSRVSQAVVRATSPETFLEQACREIVEGGGFLLVWIGQVESMTNAVVPTAFWGGISEYIQDITVYADNRPEGRGPTGNCVHRHRPIVHNDFLHDPQTLPWRDRAVPFGIAAAAAFPIERAGRVWGALTIYSDEVDRFGYEDVELLGKVAGDIGFALDNLDREFRRKQAEDALRESEERFSRFFRAAPVSTSITRLSDGQFADINDAFLVLFGSTREEVVGQDPLKLGMWANPEDRAKMVEILQERGRIQDFETRFLRKSGEIRDVSVSGVVIEMAGQQYILGLTHDITERKRMEVELRENEAQLRQIIDLVPHMIFVKDWDGKYLLVNKAVAEGYNTIVSALTGKYHSDFHPEVGELRHMLQDDREVMMKGETKFIPKEPYTDAHGNLRFLQTTKVPFYISGDKRPAVLGVAIDITERERAEEEIAHQNKFLNTVLESLQHPFYVLNADDHTVKMVNPAAARSDLSPNATCFALTHRRDKPCDSSEHPCPIETIKRTRQSLTMEHIHYDIEGNARHVEVHAHPIFDNEGNVVQIIEYCLDITERKRAEQDKEKLETQLRQSQKLEAVGTLAGGIAHDFNNILQPIIGYTEMELNELSPSSPMREGLEQVLIASLRAKELIRQILAISRSTQEQQMIPTDISSIIKEALKLLRSSLPTSIEIREKIQMGVAMADSTQIHQVLMNLCTNAAHAMDYKGILEVSLSSVYLSESDLADRSFVGLKSGPYLRLTVSDTGCGMDASTMERIFDPYFTTKEVGKGSGLGLAVIHGIVKRHEGAITVQSEPGKGTTFSVYIPGVDAQPEATMQVDNLLPRGSESILLVDDEPTVMEIGTILLKGLGYKVTSRTDSVEALEVFRSSPDVFDLVITDYTMPKLTGLDFAREVKRIRPDTPILLCTGFSEKITTDSVKELGMRLLMKPYSMRQISEEIRKILDARKGAD
jgi:PAS domain S-box-containing protein